MMDLDSSDPSERLYAQYNRSLPLADRIGYVARMRMYREFLKLMQPGPDSRILDIGVTDDLNSRSANLLEQIYPHKDRLTCAGLTEGHLIEKAYPGVRHVRIERGLPLPFANAEFDIVYSNAVLEHVGSRQEQARFVQEACRVGKRVFIAVPNPLFPIEVHTGLPLVHFLPKAWFRALLARSRFDFYAKEENLNYLRAPELRHIFPPDRPAKTLYSGVGIGPFRSNLISYSL